MTTKMPYGEGSISLRKDGRWEVAVRDTRTGDKIRRYARTEADAKRLRRAMLEAERAGTLTAKKSVMLQTVYDAWIIQRAGKRRREATVRHYRDRLELHVLPVLGRRRIADITIFEVEDLYDTLAAKGMKRESVRSIQNAFAALLTDAKHERLVGFNAAREARLPEFAESPKPKVPTPLQVVALLDRSRGTEIESILILLVGTGCRIGEALAAKWSDFDLDAKTWLISRTTTMAANGSIVIGSRTKSGESRTVTLPTEAVDALKRQRATVNQLRLRAGRAWTDNDLVFPTSIGTPQDSRNLRKTMRTVSEAAEYPGSFHSLRHFYASVATSAVPLTTVSKVLGHQRTATTADLYSHLLEKDSAIVTDAVTAAVEQARQEKRRS